MTFRILMIAPTSFFSDYGGHIRILEETIALQALGHQVVIVTYYKGNDVPGLDIRRTAQLPWHTEYEVGSSRHKLAFDVYLAAQALVEAIRFRPHVIHGHMHEGALIGGMVARLLRVPLVFDFQGGLTAEMVDHHFLDPNGRFFPWVYRLERFICHLPQATLTSSHRATQLLQETFAVPAAHIHPLPDCADTTRFNPAQFSPQAKAALRDQLQIPPDCPIVVYLGLLTDYQGIPHILETAVHFKQTGRRAHFLIMGYPNLNKYKLMAQQLGVTETVTFTGKIPYANAPYYLSLGDVAVTPKQSNTEGSGKLLNYMAMAQPVVAYDSAVHREYLADSGVYVPMGDIAAFSQAVAALLDDPERRHCLGEKLRQRAIQSYNWQKAAQHIETVYQQLTADKSLL